MITTVDLFAGAGGASEGIRQAVEAMGARHRGLAVNHWQVAVETLEANMPHLRVIPQALEAVVPAEVLPGRGRMKLVDLLWASPSCTHHSKALGGKPRQNQLRAQPELIFTWLDQAYVKRLIVENVPEFVHWGPLGRDGRPLGSCQGNSFRAWVEAIRARNYLVEWRILTCADYGDATTRQRFFLLAVRRGCGGLRWPEATHSEDGQATLFGERERWRGFDTCLDWADLGRLLSERRRPLAENTMRRIMAGIRKFYGRAFVFDFSKHGDSLADAPLRTQTGKNRFALATPIVMGKQNNPASVLADKPVMTLTSKGQPMLLTPLVTDCNYPNDMRRDRLTTCATYPVGTVITKGRFALATPLAQGGVIVDCFFRMCKPEELKAAHSFPESYVLTGNNSDQVRQIGNSVPVCTARAMAQAALAG